MVGGLHLLHSRRDIIAAFWQGSELIGCRAEVARESRRRGWCVFGTSSPCGGTLDARPHLPAESSDGEAVVQSRRPERGENHRPPRPSGWARSANLPTASPRWLLTSATWRPSPAARREASVSLCCCRSDLGERASSGTRGGICTCSTFADLSNRAYISPERQKRLIKKYCLCDAYDMSAEGTVGAT